MLAVVQVAMKTHCGALLANSEGSWRLDFGNLRSLLILQFQVRYFKDKGYAFVRFDNKESACNAIVALHLTEVLHLF